MGRRERVGEGKRQGREGKGRGETGGDGKEGIASSLFNFWLRACL